MKHFITSLLLLCGYLLCGAQATSLTIDNQTPGWLSSKIGYGDQQSVQNLTISGFLNPEDLKFIGSLINNHNLNGHINLENCQIIDKTGAISNNLDQKSFAISYLPHVTEISKITFPLNLISAKICFEKITIDTVVAGGSVMSKISPENFLITSGDRGSRNGNISHVLLREGVEVIDGDAFSDAGSIQGKDYDNAYSRNHARASMLESLTLPTSIKAIGYGAFSYCLNLKEMNLPSTLESIGSFAFAMTGFRPDTLYLPEKLVKYYTTSLCFKKGQTVIIPESVKEIDNTYETYDNMYNTHYLHDYINYDDNYIWVMKSSTPPSMKYNSENCLKNSIIYVPHNSYAAYSAKKPYSFATIIEAKVVENVSVSPKTTTLNVGEGTKLNVNVYPTDAEDLSILWSTDDASIASVTSDGIVTALSPGKTKIYATSNAIPNICDFCEVTVLQPVKGITLTPTPLELTEEESAQLVANVLPENASNKEVTWTSSDISVAMVSPQGMVYAIKPGTATIMATTVDGGFVALCKVTVKSKIIVASEIQISSKSETIAVGETVQLNATVSPENTTNKTVKWTVTNQNVATVDAAGLVTAMSEGTTQIIVTTTDGSNLSAMCEIKVEKKFVNVSNIKIEPSETRIAIGHSTKLSVKISPEDATNKAIVWSSTTPDVASVAQDGTVTAISEGNTSIVASTQDGSNLSAACQVTVYNDVVLVSKIVLSPEMIEGKENESVSITATVLPENASNKQLQWYSSNDDIATVTEGVVKLHKKGSTIIAAEATDGSNVKSECTIIVSENSGIESIIEDTNTYVKIFDLNGYLIYEGVYADAHLISGTYIVLCNGRSTKARIE